MKKIIYCLLMVVLVVGCISACGTSGNSAAADEQTTVQVDADSTVAADNSASIDDSQAGNSTDISETVADDAAAPGENSDNEEVALGDNSGNEESTPGENLDSADSPSADAVKPADAQNGTPDVHGFGKFVTEDLEGNEVNEDIFAQKDYTMLNLWGTFCPPCIAEMPELQELNENMPDNIQIVGLICDLYYGSADKSVKSDAEEIVSSSGVKYTNLMLWPDAAAIISEMTQFVPTTFFVDSSGNIVGEPIVGANVDEYKDRIAELAK